MGVNQVLTLSETSVINTDNTSKVRIRWTSTQTGASYNEYKRTAKYWVSINGGAETEYTTSYRLPYQDTRVVLDTTITVTHRDDGTGTVKVRTWMDTDIAEGIIQKSAEVTLTTIPRASKITSAAETKLGDYCNVSWTPLSKTFRYKLIFSLGEWRTESSIIYPGDTITYGYRALIPYTVAEQIPRTEGTVSVTLYTYSDSDAKVQVGSADTATFKVTVPNVSITQPSPYMALSPRSSLPTTFDGLYIQGKSKVDADFSGVGKFGATIQSYGMTVQGKTYASSPYTSDILTQSGSITVKGTAIDSRGYQGTESQRITVIPYTAPKINVSVCERCDKNGKLSESGTYLKIKAQRAYSKVIDADGVQHNTCRIQYRYAVEGGSYGQWTTILPTDAEGDEVETDALLSGALDVRYTYIVQVGVIDSVGEYSNTIYTVMSEAVFMHRRAGGKGLGLGKYCEEDDLLDTAWNARIRGKLRLLENGNPVVDFVTEKGTSNGWNYIKRNSGLIEAWYSENLGEISLSESMAANIYSNATYAAKQIPLPSGMVGGRLYHASANVESNGYTYCQVATHDEASGTLTYRIWSPYSSAPKNVVIMIYCVGRE